MAVYQELNLLQDNDVTLTGTVSAGADAVDLTDVQLEMYIKPDSSTDDDADTVTALTSENGDITIGPGVGEYSVDVPASAVLGAGAAWYRVDAISDGKRTTAMMGVLWVRDT